MDATQSIHSEWSITRYCNRTKKLMYWLHSHRHASKSLMYATDLLILNLTLQDITYVPINFFGKQTFEFDDFYFADMYGGRTQSLSTSS